MAKISNPGISITLPRGWWRSVIDAVRDAGPEYALLAQNLQNAVDGAPQHADFDLPPITRVTEIEQHDLVDALTKAAGACDAHWKLARGEDKTAYWGAGVALQELRRALLNPERDGVAMPPAPGPTTPASPGGSGADASATSAANAGATPSPLCGNLHPWLPGIYCGRKPHGDRERHYSRPPEGPASRTVINWVAP